MSNSKTKPVMANVIYSQAAEGALFALLDSGARKASVYITEYDVVTATAMHKHDKRSRSRSVMLTMGRPNFRGRLFIKACKKAGEPFPVKKVQLKFWPKK